MEIITTFTHQVMKNLITLLVLSFLLSCKEESDPNPIGCQMGRNPQNSLTWRTYRCATYKQFLAGNNASAGGTTVWNSYKENKWELCNDCK
jgi:hypothetical protein